MAGNPFTDAPPRPSAPARSGWTAGRVIALVAGSVLLLISLALFAGGGIGVWADTEQHHSGYVTTSTATYSTRGYALANDAIGLHSRWGWLGLFVDEVRIRISSEPSRPLFAASLLLVTSSITWPASATPRWAPVANATSPAIRAPGSLRPRPPRCPGPYGPRATGT